VFATVIRSQEAIEKVLIFDSWEEALKGALREGASLKENLTIVNDNKIMGNNHIYEVVKVNNKDGYDLR
jgi:hypothetical protein